MRILLDSNILFFAILTAGAERCLLEKIISQYHVMVVTDLIVEKINRVFERKLKPQKLNSAVKTFGSLLNTKFAYCKSKKEYKKHILEAQKLINKKDVPILAAGLQTEIDALVTGDGHFIKNKHLKRLHGKKIFTTREFILFLTDCTMPDTFWTP